MNKALQRKWEILERKGRVPNANGFMKADLGRFREVEIWCSLR